jgi:hypothetical protein
MNALVSCFRGLVADMDIEHPRRSLKSEQEALA